MSPPSKELMHFNPRSPHGERRAADDQRVAAVGISTHAPRTGSDGFIASHKPTSLISTHAPRTGSDGSCSRRASAPPCYFNPRSPHGERRWITFWGLRTNDFNPRSPHGERPNRVLVLIL